LSASARLGNEPATTSYQLPSDRHTNKFGRGFPSVYDKMMAELKELDKNLLAEMRKEIA